MDFSTFLMHDLGIILWFILLPALYLFIKMSGTYDKLTSGKQFLSRIVFIYLPIFAIIAIFVFFFAFNGLIQKNSNSQNGAVDPKIEQMVNSYKSNLPIKLDDITSLTDVQMKDNSHLMLTYNLNMTKDPFDRIFPKLQHNVLDNWCNKFGNLKTLNILNIYKDENNSYLGQIEVNKEVCQEY